MADRAPSTATTYGHGYYVYSHPASCPPYHGSVAVALVPSPHINFLHIELAVLETNQPQIPDLRTHLQNGPVAEGLASGC